MCGGRERFRDELCNKLGMLSVGLFFSEGIFAGRTVVGVSRKERLCEMGVLRAYDIGYAVSMAY